MSNRNKDEEGGGGEGSTEGRWHGGSGGKGKRIKGRRTGGPERGKKGKDGELRGGPHTHTSGERDRGGPSSYCNAEVSILAALSYSPRQQHDTSAIMPPTTKSNGEACCSPRAIYNISFRRPSNFRVHDLFLFLEEEEFKGIEGKPIGQRVQLELIRIEDKK